MGSLRNSPYRVQGEQVARRKEVSNGRYKHDGNEMSRYEGD